ncbi:hypothetical protein TSUD_219080 [Trifolium subterraneum]|uniref:BED-type domain-containing protein n=1 Tax=Trifolium subterraneum TaxID=3900 RepID=A0A2Z6NLT9_TRISU|nr:hypothetical protein TSUD_219080 [Trifolium subterraneum]
MDDIDIDMDNESTQNEILEVNGDGSQPPIAAVRDGFQPPNATEATTAVEASLPPKQTKKRKPNANGPRKTSPTWESFTKLPESECPEVTAACNYCGKRYLCDPKSHGTTNMLVHSKICPKNPQILSNDPSQTVLTLGHTLGAASHRFNAEACKRAITKFIILDEQPFKLAIRDSDPVLSAMGKDMKLKYEKYWGNVMNMNDLIYFGVILDPCFKMRFFEYILPQMYNDQPELAEAVLTKVKTNLVKMFNWYASAHDHQNRNRPSSSGSSGLSMAGSSVSAEQLNVVRPQSGFKNYLKEMNSSVRRTELEKYLDAPNIDEEGEFDVLLWDMFATPVSTVASESAFSTGGRILDCFWSCLSPEMAESLICTQNWLLPCNNQFKDQHSQEDLDASEKIVKELCESLASTSFGADPSSAATPAVDPFATGPPSQSRPFGHG